MIAVLCLTHWFYRWALQAHPVPDFLRLFSSRQAIAIDPDRSTIREFPRPIRRVLTELVVTVGKRLCSPDETNRIIVSA
jgi:hypothetical protein